MNEEENDGDFSEGENLNREKGFRTSSVTH